MPLVGAEKNCGWFWQRGAGHRGAHGALACAVDRDRLVAATTAAGFFARRNPIARLVCGGRTWACGSHLAFTRVPRPVFGTTVVLSLALLPVPLLLMTTLSPLEGAAAFWCAAGVCAAYAGLYLARGLQGITGRSQLKAAALGLLFIGAFIGMSVGDECHPRSLGTWRHPGGVGRRYRRARRCFVRTGGPHRPAARRDSARTSRRCRGHSLWALRAWARKKCSLKRLVLHRASLARSMRRTPDSYCSSTMSAICTTSRWLASRDSTMR